MPRKKREISATGIYHVMLRGINKQDIFFDETDYLSMMRVLADAPMLRKPGSKEAENYDECHIYAYALMPNHIHLLIKEGNCNISEVMKKIEDRFVFFYNTRYERVGHLFQGRFRSEPVNDRAYFMQLLRYIHRNPVKGMLCSRPEDYPYSSWREYIKDAVVLMPICRTQAVLKSIDYEELVEWVNMDVDDKCMDMNQERFVVSDAQAWEIIRDIAQVESPEEFKLFSAEVQESMIIEALRSGVSLRQASRLSSLSYSKLQRDIGGSRGFCPPITGEPKGV